MMDLSLCDIRLIHDHPLLIFLERSEQRSTVPGNRCSWHMGGMETDVLVDILGEVKYLRKI